MEKGRRGEKVEEGVTKMDKGRRGEEVGERWKALEETTT